ncbi:Hypothetical_protein [Hexamita inflata]|uniref:Hypothetical_protein n=1 Tax=Hexamita inflata TaxID=28002 RepID=A0AA86TPY8_9EUKA|nr:Hypothetical protein HINF_LOCUS11625 [Hexamita inflata]
MAQLQTQTLFRRGLKLNTTIYILKGYNTAEKYKWIPPENIQIANGADASSRLSATFGVNTHIQHYHLATGNFSQNNNYSATYQCQKSPRIMENQLKWMLSWRAAVDLHLQCFNEVINIIIK